jgi:hypothetical protein
MRTMVWRTALALACIACAGGVSRAWADESLIAEIPFRFTAMKQVHDPGKYEFTISGDESIVDLSQKGKSTGLVEVMTRIAAPENGTSPHLVFDKVGGSYYLSELWLPGQDGFLLSATKVRHTHHAVTLTKGARTN